MKAFQIIADGRTLDIDAQILRAQATVVGRLLSNRVTGKLYKAGFNSKDIELLEGLWNCLHAMLDGRPPRPLLSCPQCKSTDVLFHDGALGYEAIRCNACNEETDCHDTTNHSQRTDRTKRESGR